jgi:hypothetical protein
MCSTHPFPRRKHVVGIASHPLEKIPRIEAGRHTHRQAGRQAGRLGTERAAAHQAGRQAGRQAKVSTRSLQKHMSRAVISHQSGVRYIGGGRDADGGRLCRRRE